MSACGELASGAELNSDFMSRETPGAYFILKQNKTFFLLRKKQNNLERNICI